MNQKAFTTLSLLPALLDNLGSLGYTEMTPIQAHSLPDMLNGHDVIARAKTGSGKTAAFGLSILNNLNTENYSIQALVLCPTRELAEQVAQTLRQLARQISNIKILNLSGGIPIKSQVDSLKHSPHIIVGTPGRVQKHLDRETINLKALKVLVLDEADRMLDMGFFDDISHVVKHCPAKRQTLLFSATYPPAIKGLSSTLMHEPKIVMIEEEDTELDIEQLFYEVKTQANKFILLRDLLLHYNLKSTLIFCNTKDQTNKLTDLLNDQGFSAGALNGDMEQFERDIAIIRFKNQSISILVATDVAARGLDIKELPAVINYDLAFDPEVHVHRIGRTGRAGNEGLAISITTPADATRLTIIQDELGQDLVWGTRDFDYENVEIAQPEMLTLSLNIGRKNKIRPGDIMGALSKDAGLKADMIGKIDVTQLYTYVALHHSQITAALKYFKTGKVKGCKVNAKRI